MRHTPPEESYSRCLKWVRDPGGTTGHPEKLGPAAVLAPRPPTAPGTLPAPSVPLTTAHARPRHRAREREPLRLPHALGPCATGRPGAGLPLGATSSRRHAGGQGAPPFQQPLRRARSPRKVWRSEGWRPGGGGAASPPKASDRSHGRAPPTGEARIELFYRCSRTWDWSPGEWLAPRRRGSPMRDC